MNKIAELRDLIGRINSLVYTAGNMGQNSKQKWAFLVSCHECFEPALKSTSDALFEFSMIINKCADFADGSPDASPRDKLANEILEVANKVMESILNHWRKQK